MDFDGKATNNFPDSQVLPSAPQTEVETTVVTDDVDVLVSGADVAVLRTRRRLPKPAEALKYLIVFGWPLILFALTLAFRRLMFSDVAIAEFYSSRIRPILIWPLTALTNLLPISVSFIALILLIILVPILLIRLILTFRVKRGARLIYVMKHFAFIAGLLSIAFLLYMLFHGGNFARYSMAQIFGYSIREHSEEELYDVAVWLRDNAGAVRSGLNEDEDGVYAWPEGETTASMLAAAYETYANLDGEQAVFSGQYVKPKIVPLSNYWSYTGTAGMFMPMLGEANVNTDMRADEIPATALHEIAHVKGIAREDEANFMAFYTGIRHESTDFQYSSWLAALIQASNQLYRNNKTLWTEFWADMPDTIRRDLAARNVYWDQFKGPVQESSQKVNNNFLMANGEDDGIKSYGRMVDLVLAYYEHEVLNAHNIAR